ncbi:MAG: FAD-dependent oxidoreductase [Bacteroidia bacterium]|nr:FAD-dependent oxidoreductase [Bacteroidia bacterium]
MKRSEFLRISAILGIGMPLLSRCGSTKPEIISQAGEKIIVIGAGAAGLSAAYLLNKKGADVRVLEASDTYGGRIESVKGFTDFTIPVGAEWLHTKEPVLDDMLADSSVEVDVQTTSYNFDLDHGLDAETGERVNLKAIGFSESDLRFTNSSWLDFYEKYILPSIKNKIQYNQIVNTIDYTNKKIEVKTQEKVFTADRVIVTVPVTILKAGEIEFIPALPGKKKEAIENLNLYGGCKCFIAFKEQFYPTCVKIQDEGKGPTRVYFDAAYGKDSKDNVLGLLAVDHYAKAYLSLEDPERINFMLKELDDIFEGQATPNYIKHVFKDWSNDPFAKGTYYPEFSKKTYSAVKSMSQPVEDKLFFAGDLYTDGKNGWSMVHVAAEAAKKTVESLVGKI